MIQRIAYEALMRLADQFPVIAITGPRQSGKSTLAQAAFPNKKYISFDDSNYRELAKSNPGDFLKAFFREKIFLWCDYYIYGILSSDER